MTVTDTIHENLRIPTGGAELEADIHVPPRALGVVLFAHGSGSSRLSPRNIFVAEQLQQAGLATVLVDLLTPTEEQIDRRTPKLRFDIPMLAARLVALTEWITQHDSTAEKPIGLFGASTGAGGALIAAAARPVLVSTVVSRGGRPDLASDFLYLVRQPVLLIVGQHDGPVIELNRRAREKLRGEARLEIVPGATHLFEEPGTLEQVAMLARHWFADQMQTEEPHLSTR
jgi:pimeloyl-ACP methyl ester carboxylesterase